MNVPRPLIGIGRVTVLVLTVLLTSLSVAGCGITQDDAPRVIDRDAIPELRSPTSPPVVPAGSDTVKLYFPKLSGDQMVRVERSVENSLDEHATIQHLINGPTSSERERDDVTTSIPAGTELLGVAREGDLLIINLNEGIDSVEGAGLINAYAQLVLTADKIVGINRVQFRVNGEDRPGSSDDGPKDVLEPENYAGANFAG